MAFLTQGSGFHGGVFSGQLEPWPGTTKPVRNACAVVGPDPTVKSGSPVTLDGSQSEAANVPTGPVAYKWSQLSGASATLGDANTSTAKFTAPSLAVGAANATQTFKLTATPSNGAPSVDSRFLTVTVTAPPDTTAPTVAAPTAVQATGTTLKKATVTTLTTTATDNVSVAGVTFFYTYTAITGKQTGTLIAKKSTTANQWTNTFTPSVAGTYTFTAVATDAAGNQTTSGATTKTVQ